MGLEGFEFLGLGGDQGVEAAQARDDALFRRLSDSRFGDFKFKLHFHESRRILIGSEGEIRLHAV